MGSQTATITAHYTEFNRSEKLKHLPTKQSYTRNLDLSHHAFPQQTYTKMTADS